MAGERYTALGLMSGTSCDGVDAAIVYTDGETVFDIGPGHSREYSKGERALLREALKVATTWLADSPMPEAVLTAEAMLTSAHVEVVRNLLADNLLQPEDIDLIGFHGQTVLHQPTKRRTIQIGDGQALARQCGINTVFDFRSADVAAGGEGAPLAPLYHVARAQALKLDAPVVIVNIGGVSNITWISPTNMVLAFDTGPGNAPIDDWVQKHFGVVYDSEGLIAAQGVADEARISKGLLHPFFVTSPPKSLDRNDFTLGLAEGLGREDGAATLTHFTAASIALSLKHCPEPPKRLLITGGGRHNPVLMDALTQRTSLVVEPVEAVGWRGDLIEAEAFGFLAVRHAKGLPLSLPSTTSVPQPMCGGQLAKAH